MFSLFNVICLLVFFSPCFLCNPDLNTTTTFLLINGNDTFLPEIGISVWSSIKSTKKPSTKLKLNKRASKKNLGDKCSTYNECPSAAFCISGVCSCPYEYYTYISSSQPDLAVCRKKIKYGFNCNLTDDCVGYDTNSACYDGTCKCINGTHYIGSRNLLSYHKRCYKILEREGDICEIDEQCSRLADNHHKCRCIGRCDCASINRYGGCSICHENIKRTFFGGAAFIVILLSSRVFSKMRSRTSSRQQQNIPTSGSRFYRLNTSRTVPLRSVSYTRSNLRANRHVTTSLPDVFLIESHSLIGIHSSNTTDFYPQTTSPSTTDRSAERNEDAPPSYEDIIGDDCIVWNEPPPAYHEVTAKNP